MNNQLIHVSILLVLAYIIYNMTCSSNITNAGNVQEVAHTLDQEVTLSADENNTETQDLKPYDPDKALEAKVSNEFDLLSPGTNPDVIDFNKNNVDKYDSKDYLPKEINDQWFETDFTGAKYNINDDNLINTERYVVGINTVGQSLKNASYDLRGTIANPKFTVSPWNNSTYEPDHNLRPLC